MRTPLLILAALLGLPLPVGAQAAPFGPIPSQDASPLQRVGFAHAVEGADLVRVGSAQTELRVGYSNTFAVDSTATHRLLVDMERASTEIGLRWGAAPRLELGGRVSLESTGGGVLDGFIQGWHHAFRLPNANRSRYPTGVYAERLTDGAGNVLLDIPRQRLALEDLRFSAKWRAWQSSDGRALMSLSGTARLPMEERLIGERFIDVSVSALARMSWTRWHVHGAIGGATERAAAGLDGLMRRRAFFVDAAVERSLGSRLSGIVQVAAESPRLRGFHERKVDGWPIVMLFGASGQLSRTWRMDVSLQEDVPPGSPAADFMLGFGLRRVR